MKRLQFYTFLLILFLSIVEKSYAEADRFRLVIRDNPATSICIGWDQISGERPLLYLGTKKANGDLSQYTDSFAITRKVVFREMNNHFVRLTQLNPATAYFFVVKDSEGLSREYWFETLPDNPNTPLSVVCGGDSRRSSPGSRSHDPRVNSNKMVAKIKPHFVAFGGDYTLHDNDKQWITWFDDWQYSIDETGRITPLVPTRGNHEKSNEVMFHLFDVATQDVVYALNFGGNLLRLYTLNTLIPVAGSDQTMWLKNDLEEHKGKETWRMAQYHHPIVPHQSHKPIKPHQYEHWAPLFYQYNMNMAVECDAHVVKITWPIKPDPAGEKGFVRDDQRGTIYFGEGSWGLIRKVDVCHDWTRATGSFTQFKWLVVSQEKVILRTVKTADVKEANAVDLNDRYAVPEGFSLWEVEGRSEIIVNP